MLKTQFFLYEFSLEEKQRFLDKVVGNMEDLIFVFELGTNNIVFHNNSFNQHSYWEQFLSAPNFLEAIKTRLSPIDLPALQQLEERVTRLQNRDFVVRDLHIKNREQLYCHYQIEMSLFDKLEGRPVQVMCKVHTEQDQLVSREELKTENGFSKIILIDDDELTNILNEKIIETVMPEANVQVFESVDASLDWLKINDTKGDFLIFLDINFPGKNGWDFLKSYDAFATQSKVIVLSSSIVPSDRAKAMTYKSVIQYLCKPLSFEIVESLLH